MANEPNELLVLIEKYNSNPETPLSGQKLSSVLLYTVEFVRDGEKIHIFEEHYGFGQGREITVRSGRREYGGCGRLSTAVLKVRDNGLTPGDSKLELELETICTSHEREKSLEHQLKCLRIGMEIITELYASTTAKADNPSQVATQGGDMPLHPEDCLLPA